MASNEIEVLDAAAAADEMQEIAAGREVNRRRFLATLGMTGAAAGTAGLIAGCSATTTTTTSTTQPNQAQVDALNFALNLEYLEATFYSFITKGTDLTGTAVAGSGAITGAPGLLAFTGTNAPQITDMLNEITYDEINHITALRNILGSSAVARPAINLAAFGAVTATNALTIARALEDVGVTAYAALTTLLSSSSITITAQILGVESFHAGALRLVSLQNPSIAAYVKVDSIDVPILDPGTAAASAAGPTASGAFFATAGVPTSSAANPAGMAFTRTTSQVLAVLYGSAAGSLASSGAKSGGFFPSGLNGGIVSV